MSAVFGILALGSGTVETRSIDRMAGALAHRAPDGSRHWSDGNVAIGHGLMRVTNEDRFDHQPLIEDDLVLASDLRLDNRETLAEALGITSDRLSEQPDSALLCAAYRAWGEDCVHHLLGDFAFAIWDRQASKLFLARDHMGQRNCFFHRGSDHFLFASEIKALWSIPTVPRELSDAAITRLLLYDRSPSANMPSQDIECLAGGERMSVDAEGSIRRDMWWRPSADPEHVGRDDDYYVTAYRRILGEAVACRIRRATAPASLLMSGGYDSTAIAALAGTTADLRKLVAVASVMPEDYAGDIRHARRWVDFCARDMPHLDVHYVSLGGADPLDGVERRFLQQDTRAHVYDFAAGALYAAAAKAGARVVLTGYGGELTLNPRGDLIPQLLVERRWFAFARELRARSRMTGRSLWTILKGEVIAKLWPGVARRWGRRSSAQAPWHGTPVNPALATEMVDAGVISAGELRKRRSRRHYLDRRLRALHRKAAMAARSEMAYAAGLEQSDPFYDRRVVELALAIPTHLQLRNGRERDLACRALASLYPAEFQRRSRLNDDMLPDFQRMVKAIEPRMLADLDRMESSGRLDRYVDFDTVRRLLAARGADDHASGWEEDTHLAFDGYLVARYVEWFRGYN